MGTKFPFFGLERTPTTNPSLYSQRNFEYADISPSWKASRVSIKHKTVRESEKSTITWKMVWKIPGAPLTVSKICEQAFNVWSNKKK